jgi:hypothetical protein
MRDKLFLKGGTFVPPFSNACLTIRNAVLVQDQIAVPASGHILQILPNPPFLILTHFFGLLHPLPLCLLHCGYVRAADIESKENFKIHLRLNLESGYRIGYERVSVDGEENVRYLRVLVMAHQCPAIFLSSHSCVSMGMPQAEHGANRSPPYRG